MDEPASACWKERGAVPLLQRRELLFESNHASSAKVSAFLMGDDVFALESLRRIPPHTTRSRMVLGCSPLP
jgi:hypothetical protein